MSEWDEYRRKNIERNNNFLQALFQKDDTSLFGSFGITNIGVKSPEAQANKTKVSMVSEQSANTFLVGCRERFPGRENQALRILEYLNEDFFPCPPLIVYGPSGSGKTVLVRNISRDLSIPNIYVLCSAYSSAAEVLRAIWDEFITHLKDKAGFQSTNAHEETNNDTGEKNMTRTFTLRKFLEYMQKWLLVSDFQSRIVVCLDHFDHLERLDSEVSSKLLLLGELLDCNMKMIYIRRHINSKYQNSLLLKFPLYSNDEIIHIAKTKAYRFLLKSDQGSGDSDHVGNSKWLNKFDGDQYFSAENGLLLTDEIKISEFINTMKECLPQLRLTTNHPVDIFNSSYLVWKLRQGSAVESRHTAISTIDSTISATAQAVTRLPFLRYIPEKSNQSEDSSNFLNSDGLLNNSSLTGVSWISDMPIKTRYLLIAAYIAAKTNKEEDKYAFGDVKRGRRKRVREGRDESTTDNAAALPTGAMLYAPKSFNMERLLTIYNHIYSMHEDSTSNSLLQWEKFRAYSDYDDTGNSVNWQIHSLERMNIIIQANSSREDQVVYYCTIDNSTALIIARSVSFPVQNYVST